MNHLKNFVEELEKGKQGRAYDYICEHAHEMGVYMLADILKDCLCIESRLVCTTQDELYTAIADEIRDYHDDEVNE